MFEDAEGAAALGGVLDFRTLLVTFDTHRFISRRMQRGVLEGQIDAFARAASEALATATD
jgi:hypothetical protein